MKIATIEAPPEKAWNWIRTIFFATIEYHATNQVLTLNRCSNLPSQPLKSTAPLLKVEQSAAKRAWRGACQGCCINRAQRPSQHDTLRLPTGTAEDAWYRFRLGAAVSYMVRHGPSIFLAQDPEHSARRRIREVLHAPLCSWASFGKMPRRVVVLFSGLLDYPPRIPELRGLRWYRWPMYRWFPYSNRDFSQLC